MEISRNIALFLSLLLIPSSAFADAWGRGCNTGRYGSGGYGSRWDNRADYRPSGYSRWNGNSYYSAPRPNPGQYGWDQAPRSEFGFRSTSLIQQGIARGQLSPREAAELRDRQRELVQEERHYTRDGYLSPGERRDLREDRQDFYGRLSHELRDGEHR